MVTIVAAGVVGGGLLVPAGAGGTATAGTAGTTQRVSVSSRGAQGNGESRFPDPSADGRYVAFESAATNLVPGDTNRADDIFVRDRRTGLTTRVSVSSTGAQARGGSVDPSISGDGRYVAFQSAATNLVPGGPDDGIYVHDRRTGRTTLVSVSSTGAHPDSFGGHPSISATGRYVTFYSAADNLIPGDTNEQWDIFVHDRRTGTTSRANLTSDGGAVHDGSSWEPSISADGRFVVFSSGAGDVVPGDTPYVTNDVFLRDRVAHTTTKVSVWPGGLVAEGDSNSPSISADGRYVAFYCSAPNVVPGEPTEHSFVWDRLTGQHHSLGPVTSSPALSADGRYAAFVSFDPEPAPAGSVSYAVRDLRIGRTTTVFTTPLDQVSLSGPRLSLDGRHVTFGVSAPVTSDDTNGIGDAFVRDLR
jgi:Tol biopolymer transport system component